MPFEEARTLLAAGEVQRRARHKHNARVFLEAALAIFERLGAAPWLERLATLEGAPALAAVQSAKRT